MHAQLLYALATGQLADHTLFRLGVTLLEQLQSHTRQQSSKGWNASLNIDVDTVTINIQGGFSEDLITALSELNCSINFCTCCAFFCYSHAFTLASYALTKTLCCKLT